MGVFTIFQLSRILDRGIRPKSNLSRDQKCNLPSTLNSGSIIVVLEANKGNKYKPTIDIAQI